MESVTRKRGEDGVGGGLVMEASTRAVEVATPLAPETCGAGNKTLRTYLPSGTGIPAGLSKWWDGWLRVQKRKQLNEAERCNHHRWISCSWTTISGFDI